MNIIYKHLFGSRTYGTNNENSDFDEKGVYIADFKDFLLGQYEETVKINKDDSIDELSKFCELLKKSNPTCLEMIFAEDKNIFTMLPEFNLFRINKNKFISKACKNTILGYAKEQIKKASGLNKMMNQEKDKMVRKGILDFCYVLLEREATMPFKKWLEINNYQQKDLSCSSVKNFPNLYTLYSFENSRGIVNEDETSTSLRNSDIPKEIKSLVHLRYDENGYKQHCSDYKKYVEWLENRNVERYVDTTKHGQKYDGKNLLHLMRLLYVSREIALTGTFTLMRPEAEYLKTIRRGEMDLETIISKAEEMFVEINELFEKSNLPELPDTDLIDEIHLKIRKSVYKQPNIFQKTFNYFKNLFKK